MLARNSAYDSERQRLEQHNSNCLKDLAVRKLKLHCAAVCSCGDCRAQLVGAALRSAKPPSMNGGEAEPRDLWSHSTVVKQRRNPASRNSTKNQDWEWSLVSTHEARIGAMNQQSAG